jgi:hypothetical protein
MVPTPSSAALAIDHYPSIEEILTKIKTHFDFNYDSKKAIKIFNAKFPYKSKYQDQPDIGTVGPF